MSTPFSTLLTPVTPEAFFADYWEHDFLHLARADATHYAHVLTLADLDAHWQSQQVAAAFVNVVKARETIEVGRWTTVESSPIGESIRVADPLKLFALLQAGATLVVNRAHRAIPRLGEFCRALAQEIGIHARANVYVTPPTAQGLDRHYDTHDILILQISGAKRWRLYDMPVPLPTKRQPWHAQYANADGASHECTLEAGDLLYLPRGLVHEALTSDSTAIHISLGLQPAYGFALVAELATLAQAQPAFRHALPHAYSSDADRSAFYTAFGRQFEQLLAAADWPTLAAQMHADDRSVPALHGRFADLVTVDALTAATPVRRRPAVVYSIERGERVLTVNFDGQSLSVPAFLASTLELFFADRSFTAGELPGLLPPAKKLDLVRQFVRAGFLTSQP